jgi:tetratricopeptide (TPR) repeat protein
VHSRWDDCLQVNQISLGVALRLGDRAAQAQAQALGFASWRQGHYDRALDRLRESLAIRRELGDPHSAAESLRELGLTLRTMGRVGEARAYWLEAAAIFERLRTTDADQVRALLAELAGTGAAHGR